MPGFPGVPNIAVGGTRSRGCRFAGAGSKENLPAEALDRLLAAGISVAAINYRFRVDAPLPGAHHDARRALRFLRSQAGRLKIDQSRVGAFGGSAGAQIAMDLAFHDDLAQKESSDPVERESTRLTCVGTSAGQTTMDVGWWIENIPAYDRPHQNFPERFGLSDQKACHAVVADTSALPLISAGDPPIYMTYSTRWPPIVQIRTNSTQMSQRSQAARELRLAQSHGTLASGGAPCRSCATCLVPLF